ncbi:YHYH protein [Rasiella sp. SM2506]|uniref:YHYH protein n=1 Tax=Rasiella sp. SM2506 TaxID=3423914 RepID=UPI003D79716D
MKGIKNLKYTGIIILATILTGCKNQNTTALHSHDANSHTHEQQDYFDSYTLEDALYGTKTVVTVKGTTRTMETNALPNHKTGTFPNDGNPNTIQPQNVTYALPVNPTYSGEALWVREPGVALNGIKFEPQTAEVVLCESGENYRVEAKQDLIDMGLDFNNAHVQPTGAYHYHGTPTSMIEAFDTGEDLVHVGFAKDGFAMYYSKSGVYTPSFRLYDENREGENCAYDRPGTHLDVPIQNSDPDGTFVSDWEYVEGLGNLDECNGTIIDGTYAYLVTDTYPYIPRCLMGEFEEERHGPPPGERLPGGERPQHDH